MGIQFMADFIHGIAPAFALEQQAGDGDDETEGVADIVISVNDAARHMDARRRLLAGVDKPAFGRARSAGTVIPKINAKIRRPGKRKIIILPDVLMRPARHARMRPRGTRHQWLETGGNFIHAEQFVQAAARILEDRQRLDAHARQPGNFNNSAHFNLLPDSGHWSVKLPEIISSVRAFFSGHRARNPPDAPAVSPVFHCSSPCNLAGAWWN